MLEAGVLMIGIVYMVATLIADVAVLAAEPADPAGERRMSVGDDPGRVCRARSQAGTGASVRGDLLRELVRSPLFLVGAVILLFWIVCAIFGNAIAPHDPLRPEPPKAINQAPSSAHLFGTDPLGRDMFSRVIVGSRDILIIAPLATLLGHRARHRARAGDGLLPRPHRRRHQPLRRGVPGAARWSSPR